MIFRIYKHIIHHFHLKIDKIIEKYEYVNILTKYLILPNIILIFLVDCNSYYCLGTIEDNNKSKMRRLFFYSDLHYKVIRI